MKLHFFTNGKAYQWGHVRSFFDFFFPVVKFHPPVTKLVRRGKKTISITTRTQFIRREHASFTAWDKTGRVIERANDFYTFRAFAVHYWNTLVIFNLRKLASVELRVAEMLLAPGVRLPIGISFAIATDATSDAGGATSASALTWNHTCTGSNPIFYMGAWNNNNSITFSSPTYNSVACTQYDTNSRVSDNGYSEVDYLVNPATGTHQASITPSSSVYRGAFGLSFSGVKQSSPLSGKNAKNATATNSTTEANTVTTTDDKSWVLAFANENHSGNITESTNTTKRIANAVTMNGGFYDSNGVVTPAGNLTLNWTGGATTGWVDTAWAMAPFAVIDAIEWNHTSQPTSHWNSSIVSV